MNKKESMHECGEEMILIKTFDEGKVRAYFCKKCEAGEYYHDYNEDLEDIKDKMIGYVEETIKILEDKGLIEKSIKEI